MVVYSLYILSKSGGLIYQKDFAPTGRQISGNQYLILAATFHSLHVISKQLTPLKAAAIRPSGQPTAAAAARASTQSSRSTRGAGRRGSQQILLSPSGGHTATTSQSPGAASVGGSSPSPSSSSPSSSGSAYPTTGNGVRRLMAHGDSGIQVLEAEGFKLHSFATPTGTKFFVVASSGQQNCDTLLRFVYDLYADYVMKNPFYEVEMPIHCAKFDQRLETVVQDTKQKDST